jgi:6-pyruvoyltetrahydropterin/6-carboxytetrahydropterin synthase
MQYVSTNPYQVHPEAEADSDHDAFWQIDEKAILSPPDGSGYDLALDVFFNARHFVVMEGHKSPEHAHSYRMRVRCQSRTLSSDDQAVIGYHILNARVDDILQVYNNALLNELPPFRKLQPTTEVLAAVTFQQLEHMLSDLLIRLISVTIWEAPTKAITYSNGLEAFQEQKAIL